LVGTRPTSQSVTDVAAAGPEEAGGAGSDIFTRKEAAATGSTEYEARVDVATASVRHEAPTSIVRNRAKARMPRAPIDLSRFAPTIATSVRAMTSGSTVILRPATQSWPITPTTSTPRRRAGSPER
jgi:hypothetical protein